MSPNRVKPRIGSIVLIDRRLDFHAGGAGLRFTVRSRDGQALAEGLTESALREQYSELYDVFKSARCRFDSPYLDARVDPRPREP